VDLSAIGALEPEAIERVRDEVTPEPTTADDLHDLLSSLVLMRTRDAWRPLWSELTERGRGQVLEHRGEELWCTTERRAEAEGALGGGEAAVAVALRGQLEIRGVTTVAPLAEATTLSEARVTAGLMVLQNEGFAMQGRYTGGDGTEWVARRLL